MKEDSWQREKEAAATIAREFRSGSAGHNISIGSFQWSSSVKIISQMSQNIDSVIQATLNAVQIGGGTEFGPPLVSCVDAITTDGLPEVVYQYGSYNAAAGEAPKTKSIPPFNLCVLITDGLASDTEAPFNAESLGRLLRGEQGPRATCHAEHVPPRVSHLEFCWGAEDAEEKLLRFRLWKH